jgi:hypothetical protein
MSPPQGPPLIPPPPHMIPILPPSILENISPVDTNPPQRVTAAIIVVEMIN